MIPVFKLTENSFRDLLALAESGTGFQVISAKLNGTKSSFLVLNADLALDLTSLPDYAGPGAAAAIGQWIRSAFEQWAHGTETALQSDSVYGASSLTEIRLLATRINSPSFPPSNPGSMSVVPPSSLVKSTTLPALRRFHRFSPFQNDRRIDPATGNFAHGTYACPDSEVPFIPTGFAAVGRFALPSPLPASWHYEINVRQGTPVLFGSVAPAFGQAGGGVEALFVGVAINVPAFRAPSTAINDE